MRWIAAALLLAWLGAAWAQPAPPLDASLREQVLILPLKGTPAQALAEEAALTVTVFLPPGDGPFPVALIHHGRNSEKRVTMPRPRFESAARYFLRKGIAVAVPQRLGYGEGHADLDPEALECRGGNHGAVYLALAQEAAAVLQGLMAQGSIIDSTRVLHVGVSVGGIGAIAAASLSPKGVVAAVNFSGGHGGNPETRPGEPCGSEAMRRMLSRLGAANAAAPVPSLWLYAENDRYFAPHHARRWHAAFAGGAAHAQLHVLPPLGEDGHRLFTQGNDQWQPMADAFLLPLGFAQPGAMPVPPASGVALDDLTALPWASPEMRERYQRFLATPGPRAFFVDPRQRRWGYAHGDDAQSRARAFCERAPAARCQPYLVNDAVVWNPN